MLRRAVLVLAVTVGFQSFAYDLRHDASGADVRWTGNVEFVLGPQVAIQLRAAKTEAAARAALATLAAVTPDLKLSLRVGENVAMGFDLTAGAKNQNDIIALKDWPYSDGALAATIVTVNGKTHEIVDADIAFNISNNAFGVIEGDDTRSVNDIQNTLTHEMGHAMGLLHNADDAKVVMYPSASLGETSKRTLAADDSAALKVLYADGSSAKASATPAAEALPVTGCSASMGDVSVLALLAMLTFRRTKRAAAFAAALMPALALAAPMLDLSGTDEVAVGSVVGAKSENRSGLFYTELELAVTACHKGACPHTVRVTVPGGKVGDLEQFVIDHPVPQLGETLAVTTTGTRQRVHRLADPDVALQFSKALAQLKGSPGPQAVSGAPGSAPQPAVKTQ